MSDQYRKENGYYDLKSVYCTSCGNRLPADANFCDVCGESREKMMKNTMTENKETFLNTRAEPFLSFSFVLRIGVGLILCQLLFYMMHYFLARQLMYNWITSKCISICFLAMSIFCVYQKEVNYKIVSVVFGFLAVVTFSINTLFPQLLYFKRIEQWDEEYLRNIRYAGILIGNIVCVGLTLAVAFVIYSVMKNQNKEKRFLYSTSIAAGVFGLFLILEKAIRFLPSRGYAYGVSYLYSFFLEILLAGFLFLAVIWISKLCNSEKRVVFLKGAGLFWGWFATASLFFSLIYFCILLRIPHPDILIYGGNVLLVILGLISYIMLLSKKKTGLYILLAASLAVLGGNILYSFQLMLMKDIGSDETVKAFGLFLGSFFGGINPLFAWLSVKFSKEGDYVKPELIEKKVTGFDKFISIFNIGAGLIWFLFPFPFIIIEKKFEPSMLIFLITGFLTLVLGLCGLISQISKHRFYRKGMKIALMIFFIIHALFILALIVMLLIYAVSRK